MKVHLEFARGQDLATLLNTLEARPRRERIAAALLAGAVPIRDAAATLCPRDEPPHLADHLNIAVVAQGKEDSEYDTSVVIGPPKRFFYDWYLEYGTEHSAAQPFYRPALDAQAPAAVTLISRTLWAGFSGAGGGEVL